MCHFTYTHTFNKGMTIPGPAGKKKCVFHPITGSCNQASKYGKDDGYFSDKALCKAAIQTDCHTQDNTDCETCFGYSTGTGPILSEPVYNCFYNPTDGKCKARGIDGGPAGHTEVSQESITLLA